MSRSGGVCHPSSGSSFTDKQGQYLAFIYAYTRIHRAPTALLPGIRSLSSAGVTPTFRSRRRWGLLSAA